MKQLFRASIMLALAGTFSMSVASASAQPLDKLKVAIGGKGLGESGVSEAGQLAGIFRKHGIDLDIFYTAGSGETQQTVISGSADIGVATGLLGAVGAYAKGAPIRVIGASFTGDANLFWYVRADAPIREPKDAAGKTVSYSTNGSSAHNVVLQMQKYLGVSFKPTATGTGPATFTQVMSGQIDVGWSGAPFGVEALEQGKIRTLWRASDVPVLAGQTSRVIIAHSDLLRSKPDVVKRYMDAYRETIDWMYSTQEGVKAYADWASVPVPVAKRTMDEFVTKAGINPDKVSDLAGIMASAVDFKYVSAPLNADQIAQFIQIPPRGK
ncbi:MAG: NitT/TauT family transport system substrate-binding protein [Hyphomicrobiales bacterium]|jgi:NitT/TauT family transport system substrate-binding protein|nr:NitT/TauT family transport system substrate-binding protein [Hyphomicrobiales bacterium]